MIKMDLTIYYSDPPLTQKEQEELDEKKKKGESYTEPRKMVDITNYVLSVTWNGNTDEAARKVDFSLAFNTTEKDSSFTAMLLNLGGFIYMYYADDTQEKVQIFSGRIFYQKRNTSNYSFEYVAYDDMIYLAQSKMNINFQNISITEAIKKVCAEVGIPVADDIPQMDTKVNWLADDQSGGSGDAAFESHRHPIDNDEELTDTWKVGDHVQLDPIYSEDDKRSGQQFIVHCKLRRFDGNG